MKEDTKDKKEPLKRPKTYVLDTSALLEDPDIMYKLNGIIVIPIAVIKELDGLKKSDDPNYHVAMAARKVARTLDNFGSYADLKKGVRLSTGGVLALSSAYDPVDGLASEADNKIVGTAVKLKRDGHNVTLFTTDGNMRTVARVSGVKGEMPLGGEGFKFEDGINSENSNNNIVGALELRKSSEIKHPGLKLLGLILLCFLVTGVLNLLITDSLAPFFAVVLIGLAIVAWIRALVRTDPIDFLGNGRDCGNSAKSSTMLKNRIDIEPYSGSYRDQADELRNNPIYYESPINVWHATLHDEK